jgi:hypothetical protein
VRRHLKTQGSIGCDRHGHRIIRNHLHLKDAIHPRLAGSGLRKSISLRAVELLEKQLDAGDAEGICSRMAKIGAEKRNVIS